MQARTLIWNGPLGAFEIAPFDAATNAAARHAAELTRAGKLISVAGGGDTVAALNKAGAAEDFTYVSTAGGAFLEWMEGKDLPGVAALKGVDALAPPRLQAGATLPKSLRRTVKSTSGAETMPNAAQADKIRAGNGFIAALDQSGGSTPKALALYGVDETPISDDAEMFDLIHADALAHRAGARLSTATRSSARSCSR